MRQTVFRGRLAAAMAVSALTGVPALPAMAACMPMRPLPPPSTWSVVTNGDLTTIDTAASFFPQGDSFSPNPTNLLPTIYEEACDSSGNAIPNSLPSTPEHPYNLHPDPVVTTLANKISPTNDLESIIKALNKSSGGRDSDGRGGDREHGRDRERGHDEHGDRGEHSGGNSSQIDQKQIQFAIDILEGNPLDRVYSGFPILHYNGPLKGKTVTPTVDGNGNVTGGSVTIHLIYYDSHIEADTNYVDPSAVKDVPWTIHYIVDILDKGSDDFSGYMMYFDSKLGNPNGVKPNVGMDNTFFPMGVGQDSEKGQRFEFDMKMAPSGYWNLTYHWGWRLHPPRVQVVENYNVPINGQKRNFAEFEAFCPTHAPNASGDCPELLNNQTFKENAINMIGDVAPAKRMWNDFRAIKAGAKGAKLKAIIADLNSAFDDWQHRNRLPKGVAEDPTADETLLFVNNTIYGHVNGFTRDMQVKMHKFNQRGTQVKVKLLNGDYFPHAYMLVDFGGMRGWENTFHNTLPIGGQGPLFTFGRNHWWINTTSGAIPIPVATRPLASRNKHRTIHIESMKGTEKDDRETPEFNRIDGRKVRHAHFRTSTENKDEIGEHTVIVNFNYDPPRRLRMYQFDALHHDEAIWSPH